MDAVNANVTGLLVGPEDGKHIINPLGGAMTIKLRDQDTAGAYSIHENVIPGGSPGPRPHIHHHHEEVFYVLEGAISVRIGTRDIRASAGSFVVVPRGEVHQPSNPDPEPARVLLIFSPSGMGTFFEEVAQRKLPLQMRPTDPEVNAELKEFAGRYGYEFADDEPR